MRRSPFQIFPWQSPFIKDLKEYIDQSMAQTRGSATIIVSNKRPWRHLLKLYEEDGHSRILPRLLTFQDVVSLWTANSGRSGRLQIGGLEGIALLRESCMTASENDEALADKISKMTLEQFLPWGNRLQNLIEEMFSEGVNPGDRLYADGEVSDTAAALLGSLGKIRQAWVEKMDALQLTTPGLDTYHAALNAGSIPPLLVPGTNHPVYIAGFHYPDGAQDKIFRSLWEQGAVVCLHTDPALLEGKNADPHCAAHARWLNDWNAPAELASSAPMEQESQTNYFAGYDLHSQLPELQQNIIKNGELDSTAIVLPTEDLLMPVLHHLQDLPVNVSMGYSLGRAQLASLFLHLFQLAESRAPDGRHYAKDLLKLLRNPFLKMLRDDNDRELRSSLGLLAAQIEGGHKYLDLNEALQKTRESLDSSQAGLLDKIMEALVVQPALVSSIESLAENLESICQLFEKHGQAVWNRFPAAAETLDRVANEFVPELQRCGLGSEQLSLSALAVIVSQWFEKEKLVFKDDPLNGIQILGILETRLLNFDNVYILNATDEALPGRIPQDPLLPDALRRWCGLPSAREKQARTAYHIFRLCKGARNVHFLWQEGVAKSALFSSKSMRSPFVEEFIWREEAKTGKIMENGKGKLKTAPAEIFAIKQEPETLLNQGGLARKLGQILKKPVSATMADAFFKCPFSFANKYLLQISPPNENDDGESALLVGTIIHDALASLLSPYENLEITISKEFTGEMLLDCLKKAMDKHQAETGLSPRTRMMLELAAPDKFKEFIERQKDKITVFAIEKTFGCQLSHQGDVWSLEGRIDRIDERESGLRLLDYKTGKTDHLAFPKDFWKNSQLFTDIETYLDNPEASPDGGAAILEQLRAKMPDLQLPWYITILNELYPGQVENAAYVAVGDDSTEKLLFRNLSPEDRILAIERCGMLVKFILLQLEQASEFAALPGKQCEFCDYAGLCKI